MAQRSFVVGRPPLHRMPDSVDAPCSARSPGWRLFRRCCTVIDSDCGVDQRTSRFGHDGEPGPRLRYVCVGELCRIQQDVNFLKIIHITPLSAALLPDDNAQSSTSISRGRTLSVMTVGWPSVFRKATMGAMGRDEPQQTRFSPYV